MIQYIESFSSDTVYQKRSEPGLVSGIKLGYKTLRQRMCLARPSKKLLDTLSILSSSDVSQRSTTSDLAKGGRPEHRDDCQGRHQGRHRWHEVDALDVDDACVNARAGRARVPPAAARTWFRKTAAWIAHFGEGVTSRCITSCVISPAAATQLETMRVLRCPLGRRRWRALSLSRCKTPRTSDARPSPGPPPHPPRTRRRREMPTMMSCRPSQSPHPPLPSSKDSR